VPAGSFTIGNDTVYLSVTDKDGNACSFIDSNYQGFGTGIVPENTGFTLHNRGGNFVLEAGHKNVLAPNKRPYQTIIPAMLTSETTGDLLASYAVMGGFMQPQGHVQVLLNMLEFGMNPQEALDKPRFLVNPNQPTSDAGQVVSLEEGIPQDVVTSLLGKGHLIEWPVTNQSRAKFGRGHVITKGAWFLAAGRDDAVNDPGVYWSGTDPRADGLATGY